MKILKFTEQNIEPTNEEVTESKLIDKKFISDNPKRVFVEINTEYGFEFKSNLEELKDLVNKAGLKDIYFYYPFPDYKLPNFVYSDDYYPGISGCSFPLETLPSPNPDQPRELFFEESAFMNILERNGLFPDFSNSFLIEAKND